MKRILKLGALIAALGAIGRMVMGRRNSDEEEA